MAGIRSLPRVANTQLAKVVGQLRGTQIIDLMIEERTDTANGARIRVDRFGLQGLQRQVL